MMMDRNKTASTTLTLFLLISIALIGCGGGGSDGDGGSNSTPLPELTVLPADYDFGIVTNGNSVAPLEATIRNSGTANLSVSDIALTGLEKDNFVLDPNGGATPCGSAAVTLVPGSECTVTVDFIPLGFDTFNDAALTIQSSDPTTPTYNLNLLGTKEEITAVNVKINQVEACPRASATVYVSVTDQGGFPVTGLIKDNFTVAEDGGGAANPTNSGFVNNMVDLSVALLMDYSFSITQEPDNVSDMENAAIGFVNQLGDNDEAEIIKYATTVEVTRSFDDPTPLTDAIVSTPDLGGGETALFDALDKAIENISARGKTRRAIVIITDGKDDDGTGNPLSSATLASVIDDANDQGIPVFTVGLGDAEAVTLQMLADDTGGTYSDSITSDNLEIIYQQLADLLFTNQYILTYTSGIPADGVGDLTVTATYGALAPAIDTKNDGVSACVP
jgi:Ca-activated chloride channel family protein